MYKHSNMELSVSEGTVYIWMVNTSTWYTPSRDDDPIGSKHVVVYYCCTVHYGIYMLFIHQQLHFLLNLEKLNFTLEYT